MKNYSKIYFIFLLVGLFLIGCVQSVENPYNGGGTNINENKPVINILNPVSGDSIYMGYTSIIYQATDYNGGPGLLLYNLFVDGVLVQSFPQNEDGSNPYLYFSTDTLEKKLGINPASWPSEISYAMTVVNIDKDFGETVLIDSIYINRKPVAPSNLVLTRISDKSFNLFWDDKASNETKYEVWRQDGSNNTFLFIKDLPINSISTNDVVNSDYINYGYKIRAVNSFGSSAFSNIAYSSGVPGGDAPTNLKGEALGASTIQLTWDDNSETEDGFVIERTNPATGNYERLVVLPKNTKEYFDSDLYPLTTYRYRIASFKSSSISAFSNVVTVSTYDKDIAAPENLIATYKPIDKAVYLTWTDNTNKEDGAIIERKETINGEFKIIGTTTADINYFSDANIVENQLYYYRARFNIVDGFKTTYSNVDTVFVYDAPPFAPSNLQITKFTDTTYSLWWTDNSDDEEGFQLWRKDGSTGVYYLYKDLLQNTTGFNDKIASGVTYFYKVRAYRSPTFSAFSNEVNNESIGSKYPAPTNLSYSIVNSNQVKLNWTNAATDELQIIVERKLQTEIDFNEIKRLSPGTTTLTDSDGLSNNLTVFYRLKTKYPQGESEYTTELTVYIP
ncbi:MAG: hypothetical protein COW71_00895 [Ignavibacteriales bacterium CG18_big_fil_WC_8_21_14_2_50_31_20]|nr:MAG: hypothetical protein COW71_00895 [Ignavibacteriales bacterium CG18_big_fil_WC_8_21_14_2_50_31_20]